MVINTEIDLTKQNNIGEYQYEKISIDDLTFLENDMQNNCLAMIENIFRYKNIIIIELSDTGKRYIFSDQHQIHENGKLVWYTKNVPCHNYTYFIYKIKSRRNVFDAYYWNHEKDNDVKTLDSFEKCLQYFDKKYAQRKPKIQVEVLS